MAEREVECRFGDRGEPVGEKADTIFEFNRFEAEGV